MNKNKWSGTEARKRFAELLRAADEEPQIIMNRGRQVGAIVGPDSLQRLQDARGAGLPTLARAFETLRGICAEERYSFRAPKRQNRDNAVADILDELPR